MYSHKICTHTYTPSHSDIKVDSNVYTHTESLDRHTEMCTHTQVTQIDTHTHTRAPTHTPRVPSSWEMARVQPGIQSRDVEPKTEQEA